MLPLMRVIANIDPPEVLDCAVTPIPGSGSAPLQVVESLAERANGILVYDATDQYIGVYLGPAGSERFLCNLGSSHPLTLSVAIPKGTRVSLRSMQPDPITIGGLSIQFLGD